MAIPKGHYDPTTIADQLKIVSGSANYSTTDDTVSALATPSISGLHVLLNSGNDTYIGAFTGTGIWHNIANGNQGLDSLRGSINSRDYLRGGKDSDTISGEFGGNDMLFGDNADDTITASKNGQCIMRGGKDNDTLRGGDKRDLLIGDFGKDILTGDHASLIPGTSSDFFVLRTDKGSGPSANLDNLSANAALVDEITDYDPSDYVILPGINNQAEIEITRAGVKHVIKVMRDGKKLFAGVINAVPDESKIIVGSLADQIYEAGNGNAIAFSQSPTLLDSFNLA